MPQRPIVLGLVLGIGLSVLATVGWRWSTSSPAAAAPPESAREQADRLLPTRSLPPPSPARPPSAALPTLPAPGPSDPPPEAAHPTLTERAARARGWLRGQLGPKLGTAGEPVARLIDSYQDAERVGWIYDAAIAAIAFAAAGDRATSGQLLAGLAHLQQDDGSWYFAYLPERGLPVRERRYVGAMAWVVLAANFHQWETGDPRFAPMAQRGLAYLLSFLDQRPDSATRGAISLGPANPRGFSAEHNLDAYAALRVRALLDGTPELGERAQSLRRFVLETLWRAEDGYFEVGYRDPTLFLDPQTWSVLSFGAAGAGKRLATAIDTARHRLAASGTLAEVTGVSGFNDNVLGSSKVWVEGSEGMVMALASLGHADAAARLHGEIARLQRPSGSLPYATRNTDAMPTAPSVAATAWFLLNELDPPRNPFRPDDHAPAAEPETGGRSYEDTP